MTQQYCVVFDYSDNNGGATHVAREEIRILLKAGKDVKTLSISGQSQLHFLFSIFFNNIRLFAYMIFSRRNFIIHTFSFFPIVILLSFISPQRFIFVIHDYLSICPSKARFDFVKQDICLVKGASLSCLTNNCGYSIKKKITHSTFTIFFRFMTKFRKLKFRALSTKSAQLLETHLQTSVSVLPNLYVWRKSVFTHESPNLHSQKPFIVFAGRESIDKGYDRFKAMETSTFHKVHVGVRGKNTTKDTYLGWLPEAEVEAVVSKADAIIYPARQIDCDPLILQLALEYKIPFYVDKQNAASDSVLKYFGKSCIVNDWNNFSIDLVHRNDISNFNYCHVNAIDIEEFYSNAFNK